MIFNGERYIPGIQGKIEIEHFHRYFSVKPYCKGKIILDIACGEGYGSNILSEVANTVIGVDLSLETINHAQKKYIKSNLIFKNGSANKIPVEDSSIDIVVSFETIEHHDVHDEMMQEIKRILKPNGILFISSPDKDNYNSELKNHNDFHIKELHFFEFKSLLSKYFKYTEFYFQRVCFGSLITTIEKSEFTYIKGDNEDFIEKFFPIYDICIGSDCLIESSSISSFYDGTNFYKKHIEIMQNMIDSMHKSMTWKIGRFILSPFSLIRKLFKNTANVES